MLQPRLLSRTQGWLNSFFSSNLRPDRPNGDLLFTYLVTDDEYNSLVEALKTTAQALQLTGPTTPWSACFCIFVSEYYRREYSGPFGWHFVKAKVGLNPDPEIRQTLTIEGLRYWKRPLRGDENRNRYLASLFSEGGLPWRQINNDTSCFNRAIRAGLKHWHARESLGGELVSHIAHFDRNLPKDFRNQTTHELIAGIVTQLMLLAEEVPLLASSTDPFKLLDSRTPGWNSRFPIPLGEQDGHDLIESWLRAAAGERQARQRLSREHTDPICRTALTATLPDWSLQSEVTLPQDINFCLNDIEISGTRVVLTLHEGDRVAAIIGTFYGHFDADSNCIIIKLRDRQFAIMRNETDQNLELHAYVEGVNIGRMIVEQAVSSLNSLPLIFDKEGDEWILKGSTSTNIASTQALVRLPSGLWIENSSDSNQIGIDNSDGTWYELNSNTSIHTPEGDVKVNVDCNASSNLGLSLNGTTCRKETRPHVTWLGWPALVFKDETLLNNSDLQYSIDAKSVQLTTLRTKFIGSGLLIVKHPDEGILLRRKIGVLPKDIHITLLQATGRSPARVNITTNTKIRIGAVIKGTRTMTNVTADGYKVEMLPNRGEFPTELVLHIKDEFETLPVSIRLPYPGIPARLVGPDNAELESHNLVLHELQGCRLLLTAQRNRKTIFHVDFELMTNTVKNLSMRRDYKVVGAPLAISLDSFKIDIERMMSARLDLDGQVRVRVATDRHLCEFSVRRFARKIRRGEFAGTLELNDIEGRQINGRAQALALLLSDLAKTPIQLHQRASEDVSIGVYEVPYKLQDSGPWLIHPSAESKDVFRPYVIDCRDNPNMDCPATSLQEAARLFNFSNNHDVFDKIISKMAASFTHTGWLYMNELATRYNHLPLSSFEAWKATSRNLDAIVASLMKLNIDRAFASRFETELAILWEEIPLYSWLNGISEYRTDLNLRVGAANVTSLTIRTKLIQLRDLLPPLFNKLIEQPKEERQPDISEPLAQHLATQWYQHLIRSRSNDEWPNFLRKPLNDWYLSQSYLPKLSALSGEHNYEVRAVCQLPMFMACLTHDSASLADLGSDTDSIRFEIRLLSNFDREWYEKMYELALTLLTTDEKIQVQ